MSESDHNSIELLAKSEWLTKLASQIAGDAARTDEFVQVALVAVWTHPPRKDVQSWVRTVLRNHRKLSWRSAMRRTHWEQQGSVEERQAATVDVVARAELERRLLDQVMGLDEPVRSTLLLRYFDELAPRVIAVKMGVRVEQVYRELEQGKSLLRGKLEEHYGGRGQWALALAPILDARCWESLGSAGLDPVHSTNALGGTREELVRETASRVSWGSRKLLAGALLVSVGGVGWWVSEAGSREEYVERGLLREEVGNAEPDLGLGLRGSEIGDGERFPAETGSESRSAGAVGVSDPTSEKVLDVGVDLAGDRVSFDSSWVVLERVTFPEGELPLVAPGIRLAGTVVNAEGDSVLGAKVSVEGRMDAVQGKRLQQALIRGEWRYQTVTDGLGHFEFDGMVPSHEDFDLLVEVGMAFPERFSLPAQSDRSLRLQVAAAGNPDSVSGTLLGPGGEVVPQTVVRMGSGQTLSDMEGEWSLPLRGVSEDAVVVSIHPLFGIVEGALESDWDGEPLALQFADKPFALAGVVVDQDGAPVPEAEIVLLDGTPFGSMTGCAELVARGRMAWHIVAGADGTFVLPGLRDRTYSLKVIDPGSLACKVYPDLLVGSDKLILSVDCEANWPPLRVVARDVFGAPLKAGRLRITLSRGRIGSTAPTLMRWVGETNLLGQTVLRGVPVRGGWLELWSASTDQSRRLARIELEAVVGGEWSPVVALPVWFEVRVGDSSGAFDRFEVVDGRGKRLAVQWTGGGTSGGGFQVLRRPDGTFARCRTNQLARGLRLLSGNVEVRTVDLALIAGGKNWVDL